MFVEFIGLVVHKLVFRTLLAQDGIALDLDGLLVDGLGVVVEQPLVVLVPDVVCDATTFQNTYISLTAPLRCPGSPSSLSYFWQFPIDNVLITCWKNKLSTLTHCLYSSVSHSVLPQYFRYFVLCPTLLH